MEIYGSMLLNKQYRLPKNELVEVLSSLNKHEKYLVDFIKINRMWYVGKNLTIPCDSKIYLKYRQSSNKQIDLDNELKILEHIEENKDNFYCSDFAITLLIKAIPNSRQKFGRKRIEKLIDYLLNSEVAYKASDEYHNL